MKTFFLLLFATTFSISVFSQTKGAQIDIYHFAAAQNRYQLDCQVTGMNTADGQNKFMLCFIKNNGNLLQIIPVNNQKFVNIADNTTYHFTLDTENGAANPPLYFVLSSGSEEAARKVLLLINNELNSIDDVLNVLNRSGITPLTYKIYNNN